jgi:hypothetical protein
VLEHLRKLDYRGISGKFHAHITLRTKHPQSDPQYLRDLCRRNKVKVTIIELRNFDTQYEYHTIVTKHYKIDDKDAVSLIITDLQGLVETFNHCGFEVIRTKLEHEDLPTINTEFSYREYHYKLRLHKNEYDRTIEFLDKYSKQFNYYLSRNLIETKNNFINQFITLRIFNETIEYADRKANLIHYFLEEYLDIMVIEFKQETAVFDTNLGLDATWIPVDGRYVEHSKVE